MNPIKFDTNAFASYAKTLPRGEYIRFIIEKFKETQKIKEESSNAKRNSKQQKDEIDLNGASESVALNYEEELKHMLFSFGANRTCDFLVLQRVECLARQFIQELLDKLVKQIQSESTARTPRTKKQKTTNESKETIEQQPAKLEHLAAILGEPRKVRRLADIVIFLRRSKLEKKTQDLEQEAEELEDLSVFVEEPVKQDSLLTEPFWHDYNVFENTNSEEKMKRLAYKNALTKGMTTEEYLSFAESAKISFIKPHKRKKFLQWCNINSYPLSINKELADVLGQLTYEHIESIVTTVVMKYGQTRFPVLTLADFTSNIDEKLSS